MLEVLAYVFEVLVLTAAYWVILRVFRHTRGIFTMFSLIAFCGAISLLTTRVDSPVFSFFANGFLRSLPLQVIMAMLTLRSGQLILSRILVFLSVVITLTKFI